MSAFVPAYDAEVGAWYVLRNCDTPNYIETRRYFYDDPEHDPHNPLRQRRTGEEKAWDDYVGETRGCCG